MMDVPNTAAGGPAYPTHPDRPSHHGAAQNHHNLMARESVESESSSTPGASDEDRIGAFSYATGNPSVLSPALVQAKNVRFELLVDPSQQQRARLPMRIGIQKHDALADISETVKNFYGLYDGGMSFEDRSGNLLIPTFDNVEDKMLIYVRTIRDDVESSNGSRTPRGHSRTSRHSLSPRKLQPPFQMMPPTGHHGYSISRPSSRTDRNRSKSPQSGRGRRSESTHTNPKSRSRGIRIRSSFDQGANDSDSDGIDGSVASSRRSKNDMLASAEISVENIVEGGRRKRAKFDSSELPLFVPPQVPTAASLSSVSPQRRVGSHPTASPFSYNNQQTFQYTHPLPSPQSHGHIDFSYGQGRHPASISGQMYNTNRNLRARPSVQYVPTRHSINGVLPTPDPTIGGSMSVISDEDVALQLMRLGDASNFSSHGRTSTSTLDDAFSGKADAASSVEESEDEFEEDEQDLPMYDEEMNSHGNHEHNHGESSCEDEEVEEDYEDHKDSSFRGESDPILPDEQGFIRPKLKKPRLDIASTPKVRSVEGSRFGKFGKPRGPGKARAKVAPSATGAPISPTSLPPHSRKASNASLNAQFQQLGPDEEDLSAKPRCQRCRKSKKGCDRQRPCGRCRDAGIGAEGCVSEDEGNGRKGRYGRHMGVTIKKDAIELIDMADAQAPLPQIPAYMPAPIGMSDKSKKRKR